MRLEDVGVGFRHEIVVEHDDIGQLARGDGSQLPFLEHAVGAVIRISAKCLRRRHRLERVECWLAGIEAFPARHRAEEIRYRVERDHWCIGTVRDDGAVGDQRMPGVGVGGAHPADALDHVGAVVAGVTRLHRSDHVQDVKARNVGWDQVLSMVDAPAEIGIIRMLRHHFLVRVQHFMVGAGADRVDRHLEPVSDRDLGHRLDLPHRCHVVAGARGGVEIGLEKPSRVRAQRTVGKDFADAAHRQMIILAVMHKIVVLQVRLERIDGFAIDVDIQPEVEFALRGNLLEEIDCSELLAHVLPGRHAVLERILRGEFYLFEQPLLPLGWAFRRACFLQRVVNRVHGLVAEHADGTPTFVAHNLAARWVRRVQTNPREFQCLLIHEDRVPTRVGHQHRVVG